jgi:glycerol-3-phosphate acyltransferase PlsX
LIIAVDAMGGDQAPAVNVKGALLAVRQFDVKVLLVGDEPQIRQLLGEDVPEISIRHAPEVVAMGSHPLEAVRRQTASSIVQGVLAVKEGLADAFVSAGNTGAAMAASLLHWGRVRGVDRPAIALAIPLPGGKRTLLLDAGAQVDSRPGHLVQHAHIGAVYAGKMWGLTDPRIGLLNIGEEETKGSELVVEVYRRLEAQNDLHFIGNVEGRDVFTGKADVVVCDGFTGNVFLKTVEGAVKLIIDMMQDAINSDISAKIGAMLMKKAMRRVKNQLDYAEYGGMPLLGVQGVCIIAHGSSNEKAIMNAIGAAKEAVRHHVVDAINEVYSQKEGTLNGKSGYLGCR